MDAAGIDLAEEELVDVDGDWRSPETARHAFRQTWCQREGIEMAVCDHPDAPDQLPPAHVDAVRRLWCDRAGTGDGAPPRYPGETCREFYAGLDVRFDTAWREERDAARANLPSLSLAGRDLRGANAIDATLVGADLTEARLEGAILSGASFRGADWAAANLQPAAAQSADFRTDQDLMQGQLEEVIGNGETLLPDRLNDRGEPYYVWSCWETPPAGFDSLVERVARVGFDIWEEPRAQPLCGRHERRKVGTPLALDAPYPEGHPLAPRE